jgi:hypothetical protein
MDVKSRISALVKIGEAIERVVRHQPSTAAEQRLMEVIGICKNSNGWFTPDFVQHRLTQISTTLRGAVLEKWVSNYELKNGAPKNILCVLAGNIPLAGFDDLLAVLITNHRFVGKLSSDDKVLFPAVLALITETAPEFEPQISIAAAKVKDVDAVIATGSNNTARYFEYYFGKYPHIIRKNRNSIAVLTGDESVEELAKLGDDVFTYYGLGCRNVTKLFVPQGFHLNLLFESWVDRGESLMNNTKYMNNYEYHRTLFLLNSEQFLDNNFFIVKEDVQLISPPGVLYFEYYDTIEEVKKYIARNKEQIQIVVGNSKEVAEVPLGNAQLTMPWDYADGVDTLDFLNRLM